MKIKRYYSGRNKMISGKHGQWVLFEDHLKALASQETGNIAQQVQCAHPPTDEPTQIKPFSETKPSICLECPARMGCYPGGELCRKRT